MSPVDILSADLLTIVRSLLALSGRSWTTLSGVLRTQRDEYLLDSGSRRVATGAAPTLKAAGGLIGTPCETEHRFWVTREPWQIRLERIGASPPNEEYAFTSMIVRGRGWWVKQAGPSGPTVISNRGQEHQTGATPQGVYNLDNLLRPAGLAEAIVPIKISTAHVGSRPALTVRCRAIESPADAFWLMGGLTTLGADAYAFTIDATLGILLRAEAFVDGQIARSEELSELMAGAPVDGSLFEPGVKGESRI